MNNNDRNLMRSIANCERLQSELAALREELASANEKIDQAWNRSHAIDHKGFIPGALDAWKRPVPQHLPYDFSGNPGASATQYCNGWNDCGGYWSGHAADLQQRLADAERRNADQLAMLHMAKELLSTISLHRTMSPNDWFESFKAEVADRLEKLRTATQPTESGASELVCNCSKIGETFNHEKHRGACPSHHIDRTGSGASE